MEAWMVIVAVVGGTATLLAALLLATVVVLFVRACSLVERKDWLDDER